MAEGLRSRPAGGRPRERSAASFVPLPGLDAVPDGRTQDAGADGNDQHQDGDGRADEGEEVGHRFASLRIPFIAQAMPMEATTRAAMVAPVSSGNSDLEPAFRRVVALALVSSEPLLALA